MEPKASATTNPQVVQRAGGSIMMAAAIKPEVFMLAAIEGTLTRTDHGCLAVTGGSDPNIVQFPYGTVLADDGQIVDIPDVGTVHLGDTITGGGGYGDPDSATELPDECQDATTVLYWQSA